MVGWRREIGWAYKLHVGMLLALGAVKSGYACDSGLMIGGVGWSLKRKVWGEGVGGGSANAASVSHLRRLSSLRNYSQPFTGWANFCRAYRARRTRSQKSRPFANALRMNPLGMNSFRIHETGPAPRKPGRGRSSRLGRARAGAASSAPTESGYGSTHPR
jgi:hypothetical protein